VLTNVVIGIEVIACERDDVDLLCQLNLEDRESVKAKRHLEACKVIFHMRMNRSALPYAFRSDTSSEKSLTTSSCLAKKFVRQAKERLCVVDTQHLDVVTINPERSMIASALGRAYSLRETRSAKPTGWSRTVHQGRPIVCREHHAVFSEELIALTKECSVIGLTHVLEHAD
jgi:hypothetical protein